MPNRQFENLHHPRMDGLPLSGREQIAPLGWVDAGQVQNLRGIQVADSRYSTLVQQRHLDSAPAFMQPLPQVIPRHVQRIGSNSPLAELRTELLLAEQPHGAQPAAIPIPDVRNGAAGQIEAKAKMLLRRWIGNQHQSRHPRLEDEPIVAVQPQDDPLSHSAHFVDPPAGNPLLQHRSPRLNQNRPPAAAHAPSAGDAATGDARNSAAHRFDFR